MTLATGAPRAATVRTGATGKLALVGGRIAQAVPALIGIIVVTFLLTRALPGDPAVYFAGPTADAETIAQVRHALGLDRSLPVQFLVYVRALLHGDLGQSISTGQSVAHELLARLPASLELTLAALTVSVGVAVPLGILAATRPDSVVDHLCRLVVTAGVSLPTFFTGLALIYVFYYRLGWSPAPTGRLDLLTSNPATVTGFFTVDALLAGDLATCRAALAQLILPAATLALFTLAPIARMTRASMLGALGQRLRAHRAGRRPVGAHRAVHLRLRQRRAAGHHHAQHGVLLRARGQRAGGEGVLLAGHRLVRGRRAGQLGLRRRAGFRPHHGGAVRGP